MAKIKLGSADVLQLLQTYEANLRQVQFQAEHIKQTIRNLKAALPAIQEAEVKEASVLTDSENMPDITAASINVTTAKKRGRPAGVKMKTTNEISAKPATTSTAGKSKKKSRSSGYKLSEYDLLVFQALEENGRAMITSDLQTAIEKIKADKGELVDSEEVLTMIIRSLQKLANRRNEISKVAYAGRGMAYALPTWVNSKGVIKNTRKRK